MKFVMAAFGSRGDVEPCAAVAVELLRRGHDVRMAVPPEMLWLHRVGGPWWDRLRAKPAEGDEPDLGFEPGT